MFRRPLLLILLLLCPFALVACGGDEDVDVDAVLRETFGDDKDINSGRLDLDLRLDARGLAQLQGPVAVRLSGPFASTDPDELPRFALEASLDAGGDSIRAGATSTGDKGFLRYEDTDYAVPADLFEQFADGYAESARESGDERGSTPSLASLGVDPLKWLTDPRRAGETDVGGTETIHLTAGIDVPKLLADVRTAAGKVSSASGQGQQLGADDVKELGDAVKSAKVDIYTGAEDHKLRKFVLDLELTTGHVTLLLQFDELNEPQEIAAPQDPQPIAGLLTALGAGGGSADPATTAPADPSAAPDQRYLDCMDDAGEDIAKAQACAKYL
jgi:hypothetical protein